MVKKPKIYTNYEELMMDQVDIFDIARKTIKDKVELSKKGAFPSSASYHRAHEEYSVFIQKNIKNPEVQYVLIFDKNARFKKEISYGK